MCQNGSIGNPLQEWLSKKCMLLDFYLCNVQMYKIPQKLLGADETLLQNGVFLILLHANSIPPHLLVGVHGKIFTLTIKGATVDSELASLLTLIRRKHIGTLFIRLSLPPL